MTNRIPSRIATLTPILGIALGTGCEHSHPTPTTRVITPPPVVVEVPAETQTVVVPATTAQAPPPPPVVSTPPQQTTPPPNPQTTLVTENPVEDVPQAAPDDTYYVEDTLNQGTREVVKLHESGVATEVIMAYATNAPEPFEISADQIIFLSDIGLDNTVITQMLEHDQRLGIETPPVTDDGQLIVESPPAEAATNPNPPVYAQTRPASYTPDTQAPQTQVVASQAPAVSTQVFYDALSPYGTWIYLDSYGWTWQPTVATVNVNWRPYYDRGRWAYTDAGWYWHSGYSWGWAPFHYGRWSLEPGYGWLWVPGTTWAPSWVSFRYTDAYCGWAPLPPQAYYTSGIGFTYYGSRVSVGFGFGLGYNHYAFVNRRHFGRNVRYRDHRVGRDQTQQIFEDSTVINNYIVGDNNTIINEGISRDRVAGGNLSEVRKVALQDVNAGNRAADRTGRGNSDESIPVYRPNVAESEGRPTERQLARQETRATRKSIEERSNRGLRQEPASRRSTGGGNGSTVASAAAASGRIAPNRTSTTASTIGATRQTQTGSVASSGLARRSPSRPSTATSIADRTRTIQRPQRAPSNASENGSGLNRRATTSPNSRAITSRSETRASRTPTTRATRGRVESSANRTTANSTRSRPIQRPQRTTTVNPRSTRQESALTRRAQTTPSTRTRTTRTEPSRQTTPSRSRVQTTPRTASPTTSRSRVVNRPSRIPSRSETTVNRSNPTSSNNALSRRSQSTPSRSRQVQPSYQTRPSTPSPSYRSTPRSTYTPPRRQAPAPTRQTAPSPRRTQPVAPRAIQNRSQSRPSTVSPSYRRTPQIRQPSASRGSSSRSSGISRSVPSRSSSPSTSRSTPQRARGIPSR